MFKSQNASTWTSEQNEDVKFKINRCKFTENTEGTVTLVNDVIPVKTLKQNPITTIAGTTNEALDDSETEIDMLSTSQFPNSSQKPWYAYYGKQCNYCWGSFWNI